MALKLMVKKFASGRSGGGRPYDNDRGYYDRGKIFTLNKKCIELLTNIEMWIACLFQVTEDGMEMAPTTTMEMMVSQYFTFLQFVFQSCTM